MFLCFWKLRVVQLPGCPPGCGPGRTSLHGVSDNGSFFTSVTASTAARMRPKRLWTSRNKLAKIFTGALDQFSTVRKTSVTDDVTNCPPRTKFLAALQVVPPWISRAAISIQGFITLSARVNDFLEYETLIRGCRHQLLKLSLLFNKS